MPYKTGVWGEQAKERSKLRKEYFKEYRRKNPQHTTLEKYIGTKVPIKLVRKVVKRANGFCEKCGVDGTTLHHIDKNPENNIIENLQLLCKGCHNTIHKTGNQFARKY